MKFSELQLLRQFIREQVSRTDQLGASIGMKTVDTTPYTFEDMPGYDVDIISNVNDGYMLTVKYKGEKIAPMSVYRDYDEAHHQSRMIIDKHRVGVVESSGQKKI